MHEHENFQAEAPQEEWEGKDKAWKGEGCPNATEVLLLN